MRNLIVEYITTFGYNSLKLFIRIDVKSVNRAFKFAASSIRFAISLRSYQSICIEEVMPTCIQNYYDGMKMKSSDYGVTAPLIKRSGKTRNRAFYFEALYRIPRLPGDENGVNMKSKSPHYPGHARGGGGPGEFQMTGA